MINNSQTKALKGRLPTKAQYTPPVMAPTTSYCVQLRNICLSPQLIFNRKVAAEKSLGGVWERKQAQYGP
jgi:hypothetical protein